MIGRLDPKTGKIVEYPFPHSENTIREFFRDSEGRMWYGSPSNNKVGYFYLTGASGGGEVRNRYIGRRHWRVRRHLRVPSGCRWLNLTGSSGKMENIRVL